jgi:thiol-disulfide isomerase/thioredoxin
MLLALACAAVDLRVARAQPSAPGFDPTQYLGRVLYLDFWASWCAPCQESFPFMVRLVRSIPSTDFSVVAVNVDHDRSKADAFLNRFGDSAPLPVVFDPSGALASRYAVKAMPTSLVIGRDGRTRYVHSGFFPEQEGLYTRHIQEIIHES